MNRNVVIAAALALTAGMIWGAVPEQARNPVAIGTTAPVAPMAAPAPLRQIRGFSMQLNLNKPENIKAYLEAVDKLADMGCTWINLVLAARQDNVHSEAIAIPFNDVPKEAELIQIMTKAKNRKMSVMLMPIVLLTNSGAKDWRGVIDPPSWDNWFASYTAYITYMAKLAKSCDVDVFCVGSELLSTEPFKDKWVDVIAQIRQVFPGKLTYSANWDHYTFPTFWDQLDYIGMNNYNELAKKPGASIEDLDKAWEPLKKKILDFAAQQKKPFMFTETGWYNTNNTITEPWNYVAQGPIEFSEQEHAFQSFVDTWGNVGNDKFMGAFIWEWYPIVDPADAPKVHITYMLEGTPALEIVKKWMATK